MFAPLHLGAENSLSLRRSDPQLESRKGEIRFGCETVGCELKSDDAVFVQIFGGHGTSLDMS